MRFPRISVAEWLVRATVAFAFLYPPFDALTDPYAWIGYFPAFLTDFVAPHGVLLLHAFGIVEVALAVWIIVGRRIRIPALMCAGLLIFIIAFNLQQFPVLFRDLAIVFAALALTVWPRRSRPVATAPSATPHGTS
jgi:uncharacterized membrane protein YphA (DoxX/SURF4 family)